MPLTKFLREGLHFAIHLSQDNFRPAHCLAMALHLLIQLVECIFTLGLRLTNVLLEAAHGDSEFVEV